MCFGPKVSCIWDGGKKEEWRNEPCIVRRNMIDKDKEKHGGTDTNFFSFHKCRIIDRRLIITPTDASTMLVVFVWYWDELAHIIADKGCFVLQEVSLTKQHK